LPDTRLWREAVIVDQLKSIVGPKGWVADAIDMRPYLTEWRDRYTGKARLIVAPKCTEEVSAVVTACIRESVAIVPQGGNTGLCGGAIPDRSGSQVVLSLRRMNRIRKISPDDYSMVVDAGCTLSQVQASASESGRFFPLSLAAEGSCQIGGNLSTNAGGINVLRYGTARAQVLGLEVVLADGRVIDGLRALRKDTAGYDLKHLFIGSEGTLGIITGACLRLQPVPDDTSTFMLALDSPGAAVQLLSKLRNSLGDTLQAFELIPDRGLRFVQRHIAGTRNPFDEVYPWYVIAACTAPGPDIEQALAKALESGIALNALIAKNSTETDALWSLRHSLSEAQKPEGASLKHDVSVPLNCVAQFIEAADAQIMRYLPGARVVAFGHVGDGNVHLNISQPKNSAADDFLQEREAIAKIIYDIVSKFGGSFSAEHGIGLARRHYLRQYRSPVELDTMRAIKHALDPLGLMNPGKVL
jgi:FAD/FMN-containing dehydrogenase